MRFLSARGALARRRGRRHVKRVQARALKMVGIRRALLMITPVNGYLWLLDIHFLEKPVGEAKSGSGSLSESGSKGSWMGFGHEKLDVYRAAIEYDGARDIARPDW